MQSEKIACVTRELEDLLMIEEKRGTLQEKKGSVADLLAEMESAVASVEAKRGQNEKLPEKMEHLQGVETAEVPEKIEPLEKAGMPEDAEMPKRAGMPKNAEVTKKAGMPERAETWECAKRNEVKSEAPKTEAAEPKTVKSVRKEPRKRFTRPEKRAKKRLRKQAMEEQDLIRSGDALVAAFLIPVVIMLIIFVQRGIFPFGEETFLRTDMYHQYAPFFSEFQYKLKSGGSLLYSWDVGMGVNFSALYAYYLASPFNWLLILCPKNLVIEFMTYQIVLKIGLCGLTMAYYLRKHCRTNDFGVAFFGIFYALSGYMAAYSWNIMWLDCIILFPLIVLGLERLVKDGKGILYCLTLGMSILSNYYISIMTCIFMVLYFIALLVLDEDMHWEKFIGRGFQFAVYSLLAGGLSAVVLLPEVFALQMTASGDVSFPKTFSQYFPIFDMIARHIGNVETEIGLDHWPNVYCGVAVLMFFILYLLCKKISAKEKAVYCVMLLFFFASFSFNVLNFIWHGFHYPNSLPCRQSYIYIFLVLFACYRAYMYLKETPWKHVTAAFAGSVVFVLMAQKLVTEDHFHFIVYYVAILFLALYLGAIALYQRGRRYYFPALFYALAVVSIEAAVNTAVTSVTTTSRTAYTDDNAAAEKLVDSVQPNDSFFRMEKVTRKTKNDGAWMHFPSVSLFSSTANADLSALFKKLGCESSTNAYSITGSTPLVDALFSVKYGIYSEKPDDTSLRTVIGEQDGVWLYQNNYTLPVGFYVEPDFESRWNLETGNPADVQNSLADALGAEQVMNLVLDTSTEGSDLTFYPETSGEYYAYVGNKKIEKVTATTWKGTKTFTNVDRGYLLELGYCVAGEAVTLTAEDSKEEMWADVYRFSENGLGSIAAKLSAHPWSLTSWTDTSLEGMISCDQEGWMFTSIPYDEGWKILVDGKEQKPEKILDSFVGIWLSAGSHTVAMEYTPKGLIPGALISGGSAVLLALIALGGWLLRRYREEQAYEQDADAYEHCEYDREERNMHAQTGAGMEHPDPERADSEMQDFEEPEIKEPEHPAEW